MSFFYFLKSENKNVTRPEVALFSCGVGDSDWIKTTNCRTLWEGKQTEKRQHFADILKASPV